MCLLLAKHSIEASSEFHQVHGLVYALKVADTKGKELELS